MQSAFNSLVLRPVAAKFIENHSSLFKQDPYVVIKLGDREFKSSVDRKGGLSPHWSDRFDLHGLEDTIATVRVYDSETFTADYLLGEANFDVDIVKFLETREQTIDLYRNETRVGEITLQFQPSIFDTRDTPKEETQTEQLSKSHSIIETVKEEMGVIGEKLSSLGKGLYHPHETTENNLATASEQQQDHKSFVETAKENLGTLGEKVGALSKAFEEKIVNLVHPHETSESGTTDATLTPATQDSQTLHNPSTAMPSSDLPADLPLQPLEPVTLNAGLNKGIADFKPAHLERQGDVLDKSNSQYYSQQPRSGEVSESPLVSNLEIVEDLTNQPQELNVQGQEFHRLPLGHRLDVGEQKNGENGLKEETQQGQIQEVWSAASTQGSVLDRSELSNLEEPTNKTLIEQGKEKLTDLSKKLQTALISDPETGAPGIITQGKTLLGDAAQKVQGALEQMVHTDKSLDSGKEQGVEMMDIEDRTKTTFQKERSEIKHVDTHFMANLEAPIKEDVRGENFDSAPNSALNSELYVPVTSSPLIESRHPSIVEKSKEIVDDFSHKADDVLNSRPLRSNSIENKFPQGPSDVDIIDIGPQNFNIDKKFNDVSTFDKAAEAQKATIFDAGLGNQRLIRKAEELSHHEEVNNEMASDDYTIKSNTHGSQKNLGSESSLN